MRQSKYLLAGGPADGRWISLPRLPVLRIPIPARSPYAEPETVLYYRHEVEVSGWVVPLTIYTPSPVLGPEVGTAMPGWVEGMRPAAHPAGAWRYLDNDEPYRGAATHEAAREENRRRCHP